MSKLGTVGRVRFCIMARLDVYGEPGGASLTEPSSSGGGEAVGPCDGPLIGPVAATGCLGGAGSGSGCGAGAASVRVIVNSISVAIKVPHMNLGDLHLSWTRRQPPHRHYFRTLFRAFCWSWAIAREMTMGYELSPGELGPIVSWHELRNHQLPAVPSRAATLPLNATLDLDVHRNLKEIRKTTRLYLQPSP
jgi:hypothetical protein